MKHELSSTFAMMMVAGTSSLWDRIPTVYKALSVIVLAFLAGGVVSAWWSENRDLPMRVTALESEVVRLQTQDEEATRERTLINDRLDTVTLLQLRTLCRLDGNTANSCDLAYGGGQKIEREQ